MRTQTIPEGPNAAIPPDKEAFGLRFATETQEDMLNALTDDPGETGDARLLVTANLDHIVTLRRDPAFREAYASAWRITADGAPVFSTRECAERRCLNA